MTPEAAVNLRLGKIIGVGKAQIVGEARKARRRNDLQNVICQLLPAPSNLPLWLCLASYVEKILIRAFAFRQAFIICSAFEDFISYVCQLCNRCICSLLRPNKYKLQTAEPFLSVKTICITKTRQCRCLFNAMQKSEKPSSMCPPSL